MATIMGPDRLRRAAAVAVLATATIAALAAPPASPVTAQQTPAPAELDLAPQRVDFGDVVVDGRDEHTVTVTNDSAFELKITDVTVAGDDSPMFDADASDCLDEGLAGGQSCEVTVGFEPTAPGERRAVLEVEASDANVDSPQRAGLTGTARRAAQLAHPEDVEFGDVAVDGRDDHTLTVTNAAGFELKITDVTVADDDPDVFDADARDCLDEELTGGQSCELTVAFEPTGPGERRAVLEIEASDADNPHRVELTGTGIVTARTEASSSGTGQSPDPTWLWLAGALGALAIVIGIWARGKTPRWVARHVRVEPRPASPHVTVAPLDRDVSPTVRIVVRRDTGTQTVHEVTR